MIDKATPRNIRAHGIHGFISRDGMPPLDLRRSAHAEVLALGVRIIDAVASDLQGIPDGFIVTLENGEQYQSPRIVLATGKTDELPPVIGMDKYYGTSVFHCPFCDGWEVRDKRLAVYSTTPHKGVAIAKGLLTWSPDVILFTNGVSVKHDDRVSASDAGIPIRQEKIRRLVGDDDRMHAMELQDGQLVERDALFFDGPTRQQWDIARKMGCRTTRTGAIRTDKKQRTEVPGLYVVGDAAADPNMVVVAAADGVKAALNIVQELQKEGHWLPGRGTKRAG